MAGAMTAHQWLRWLDSNQRVRESKSRALPLGDTPVFLVGFPLRLSRHRLLLYARSTITLRLSLLPR